MGGNALKNCTTRRYEAKEYFELCAEIAQKLHSIFSDSVMHIIDAYKMKESFGDMDILIREDTLPKEWINLLLKEFSPKETLRNGNVCSFEYKEFQIDLIVTSHENYQSSISYFAYNDLGNLCGRIAHNMGLKLGHDGLSYEFRKGTNLYRTIPIYKEWKDILPLLDLSFERYSKGFETLEDIFKFVTSSSHFNKCMFHLENRNHKDRIRDSKRKTYTQFLDWIEDYEETDLQKRVYSKEYWVGYCAYQIPGFLETYVETEKEWNKDILFKSKYNGEVVSNITGLKEKELGKFMEYIRTKQFGRRFETIILEGTDAKIKSEIERCYGWFLTKIEGFEE